MIKYRIIRLIFIGFFGAATVAGVTGWKLIFKRQHIVKEPIPFSASYLAEKCSEGGGETVLEGSIVIGGGSTSLDDCKVQLSSNSTLVLKDIAVTSGNVVFRGEGENIHIKFQNTIMRGEQAGLHVDVKADSSSIEVVQSSLQYQKSIGLMVGQEGEQVASQLFIEGSTFEVLDENTEGVVLVSTGIATVRNSVFSSANEQAPPMLLARECQATQNQGINTQCQAN